MLSSRPTAVRDVVVHSLIIIIHLFVSVDCLSTSFVCRRHSFIVHWDCVVRSSVTVVRPFVIIHLFFCLSFIVIVHCHLLSSRLTLR
ncbi:hypothetical protein BYT27DRAFT_6863164 [Phlegmacium glaucopus]|nr:hypothetical protein BYT27DRAFT_6863164 [Phlegmacium glaucopus]